MKRALWIIAAIAACVLVAVLLYSRAVHPRLVTPARPVTLYESGQRVAELSPSSPLVQSMQSWVAARQFGWHLSFDTYAQRRTFICDTFDVEVGDRYIVLNYARRSGGVCTELVRDLTPEEQSFWRDIVAAAKET